MDHSIVVPYDFTPVAMNAVAHSVILASRLNVGITLLHIIGKESEEAATQKRMQEEIRKITSQLSVTPNYLIRTGSIYKTINKVANELSATLIVMGTHGLKGIQKFTGSHALKVIVGSRIPFLVVQDAPKPNLEYKNLVFPVDFKTENKEKLKWVEFMHEHFKTKTFLVTSTSKENEIVNRTRANLSFSKTFLEERRIDYEIVILDKEKSFSDQTIDYTVERDADLIIIMTTRDISFHDYIIGAQEQYMIANAAKIPVMVINPRTDLIKYGYKNF